METNQQLDALLRVPAWQARLQRTANPGAAGVGLHRLWQAASAAVRRAILEDAGLAQALLTLFAESEFLTETLIQDPALVTWLAAERHRGGSRPRDSWSSALAEFAQPAAALPPARRALALVRFKRRELVRIAWRDLAGLAPLAETTAELSHLADASLHQAYVWAWNNMVARWGVPQHATGGAADMAVIALGKLGGEELNYASDIDLLFLYSGAGKTAGGGESTTNQEFFTRVAQAMVHMLSAATAEGAAYRVDLRLRPGGREGELALPLEQAARYYRQHARPWELQALLRARPCAGSLRLGRELLAQLADVIYPPHPDARQLAASVLASRCGIQAQLSRHRASGHQRAGVNVKLDRGGIREIEFLTQYLQRLHGGAEPWLRSANTLIGLQRLHDKRRVPGAEFQQLAAAYTRLRHVEHRLQLRLGQQTHTLPPPGNAAAAIAALTQPLPAAMAAVASTYDRYLLSPAPLGPMAPATAPEPSLDLGLDPHGQSLERRLLRSAATVPGTLERLQALPPHGREQLAHALAASDWMAAALIRRPQLVDALTAAGPPPLPPDLRALALPEAMAALRQWHQAATLAILAREGETAAPVAAPIAVTLAAHSALAEQAVQAALSLALPDAAPSLAVLGLGRLGLGELDLLSDLDLVFVAHPDEREAAARRAAALIHILSAYTQDGALFPVDVRLRPGGRDGEMVQTPESLARYFRERAGWWEAVSYLKARAIAGASATAAAALDAVQSAMAVHVAPEPLDLRDRMEQEGRPGVWGLKTPPGGSYDVDFIVARRWLQERRPPLCGRPLAAWAQALGFAELADCMTTLRAADHALRVGAGKAGAALPAAGEPLHRAWHWFERLTGVPAAEAASHLRATQQRIRRFYLNSLLDSLLP